MSRINIASDRYSIECEIGRGGMGVVLKAHDKLLDIPVAIKFLENDPTGQGVLRLQREATAAGKLSHPNIAKILDFGQTSDGTAYMVMEYIEGQSLSDLIKKESRIEIKKSLSIFIQIASAISYAHANGIVHRDIKPSNVMLVNVDTASNQIKLLDFGVAQVFNAEQVLTHTGVVVGSPLYMSPEQVHGEASASSDIYSFGCLMFETLTGQVPFRGASSLETISMHCNSAPPLLTDIISVQKLPNELVVLVDECLRKLPQGRPPDMQTVLTRLKSIYDKMENAPFTSELAQKISRQYFKLKLIQFWKSKFGLITVFAIICTLIGLSFSVFNSEHTRLVETKNIPKHSAIESPLIKEEKLVTPKGAIGKGLEFTPTADGEEVCSDNSVCDEDLRVLKDRKITAAYFDHGAFDGSGFKYLNPKYLVLLSVRNSGVTNENLKYVSSMKNLKTFRIGSPYLSDEGLKNIAGLKSLDYIYLDSNKITNDGVRQLEHFPVVELWIKSTGITNDIARSLRKMKALRRLSLINTSISANFGEDLAKNELLSNLDLSGSKLLTPKTFAPFEQSNLNSLILEDTVLAQGSLEQIAKISSLNRFIIGNTKFESKSFGSFVNLPKLKDLEFFNTNSIDDELIKQLVNMKELRILFFNNTNISDAQVLKLTKLRNLERLELFDTDIAPETYELFQETYKRIWKKECEIDGRSRI